MEMSYRNTKEALKRFLPITTTVDTLERTTKHQSNHVKDYRENKPELTEEEEDLLVITADGKGVPIKQPLPEEESKIEQHKFKTGPKTGRKRMAVVGAIYSIDRHKRTAESIVDSLFKIKKAGELSSSNGARDRPVPQNKDVIANLDREVEKKVISAASQTFAYLRDCKEKRTISKKKETVFLIDGQPSLWEQKKKYFGARFGTEILDLLHVNAYLWEAASMIYPNSKEKQISFMKHRILKILKGDIGRVIGGIKQIATKMNFSGKKKEKIEKICNYLTKNRKRMKYNEYLEKGYPISTGVIEGACRHYVKDRMERSGMRWTISGAQAMLDMRSVFINDDWDHFQQFRIQNETEQLYPYRNMLDKIEWVFIA